MLTKRKGVIGALLDEYVVVIADLKSNIHDIRDQDIPTVLDTQTKIQVVYQYSQS